MNLRLANYLKFSLLVLVGFGVILGNGFAWDDHDFIVRWEVPQSFTNWSRFWDGSAPAGHEGVYRPLRTVFYALVYPVLGLNPFLYHIVSLLFHLVMVILVYEFLHRLTGKTNVSLVASGIYAIHPVQSTMVAFTTASFDIPGLIFMMLALILFLKSRQLKNPKFLVGVWILAFLGYLGNELAITAPLMIGMLDYLGLAGKTSRKLRAVLYAGLLVGWAVYFVMRIGAVSGEARSWFISESRYHTTLAMAKVFTRYVWIQVFPVGVGINPVFAPGIFGINAEREAFFSQKATDWLSVAGVVMFAGLVWSVWFFRSRNRIVAFAVGWFLVGLIPVSNIVPFGNLYYDRYLYMPVLGFCILMALVFDWFRRRYGHVYSWAWLGLLAIYVVILIPENLEWKDNISLWTGAVRQNPLDSQNHNTLGVAYSTDGLDELAVSSFSKAIQIKPVEDKFYANRAVNLERLGKVDLAADDYLSAWKLQPEREVYAASYLNRLLVLGEAEQVKDEVSKLLKAGKNRPVYMQLRAKAYMLLGQFDLAEADLLVAIGHDPKFFEARNNLATIYIGQKKWNVSLEQLGYVLELNPKFVPAYYNRAVVNLNLGKREQARNDLEKALELDPGFEQAKSLLGRI